MTVTHVVRMWPDQGDPQLGTFVRAQISALRDLGLTQKVVVWSGSDHNPLSLDGIEVFAGPRVPMGPRGWPAKAGSVLQLGQPNLLHLHGSGGDTAYLMLRCVMQWGQRIPRVVTEHQYFGDGALPTGVLWTHRLANARTAVSPFLAKRFEPIAPVDVVPNCWTAPLPHQLRQAHSGGRRILHVGDWVDATKGISPLLKAWRLHSERNPLDRLMKIIELSGDPGIVEWLCQQTGGYYVRNPKSSCAKGYEVLPATNEIISQFSTLLHKISAAAIDHSISAKEAKEIRECWDKLKSYAEGFVRCCEEGDYDQLLHIPRPSEGPARFAVKK